MPPYTLNHIALSVKDVDTAIAFYQKVFRFKEIENTASDSKTRWLLISEGKQLHLIPRPEMKIKTSKEIHFALTTEDFDAFVDLLTELEISFCDWNDRTSKIHIRKDGIRQVYFQDPDQYWIEVNDDYK